MYMIIEDQAHRLLSFTMVLFYFKLQVLFLQISSNNFCAITYISMYRYLPTFKILCGVVSVSSLNTALIYNHLYNPSNKASLENAMIRSNAIIPRFLMNSTLSSSALLLQKWNRKRCISTWKKLYYCNYYTFLKSKCFLKSIFYFSKIGTKSNFPTPIEFRIYFDN